MSRSLAKYSDTVFCWDKTDFVSKDNHKLANNNSVQTHFQTGIMHIHALRYCVYEVIQQSVIIHFNILGAGGFAAEESVTAE